MSFGNSPRPLNMLEAILNKKLTRGPEDHVGRLGRRLYVNVELEIVLQFVRLVDLGTNKYEEEILYDEAPVAVSQANLAVVPEKADEHKPAIQAIKPLQDRTYRVYLAKYGYGLDVEDCFGNNGHDNCPLGHAFDAELETYEHWYRQTMPVERLGKLTLRQEMDRLVSSKGLKARFQRDKHQRDKQEAKWREANTIRYKRCDIIALPVRRSLNRGYKLVDPHYYILPRVDTSSLPTVDYVNELTLLRRLSCLRDPEITGRILHRMDCEMEALAILPISPNRPVYDGPVDRDSLEKWLGVWDKKGLHVIRQTTIAILRGSLDDEYEVEVPQRRGFLGRQSLTSRLYGMMKGRKGSTPIDVG
ncbi:hypothetical protein BT96DRAFT_948513 [Gymnopus androsaceus JB14]|uniref:Uncharacterized protein n=1 Tax=Gymnopus androsaceus JB14 TaxID=1447944 RepID=A0A6A4GNA5_9AGAR|nr:hypothetical protein BT96DRAFT_948513 [Gymnopus androsaceus JB14]